MSLDLITDFPDRLSPMLVKELRQGLRAKTFVAVFLTLQIAMALILFSAGAGASSANAGGVISGVIFVFFSIAVLVVQPLRGIGAVSAEIKGNTIDMMVLTRLSASRIVYGKWFALVGQSALLLSTIIPYLILRYFFGGMNLVGEIVLLLLIFLTSVALTAITVGLSGSSSFLLRAILPIVAIPFLVYIILFAMISRGSANFVEICSLDTDSSRIGVTLYIATIWYFGWSMLSLGGSLIAPAAENHSTFRRLVVLGISLITAIVLCVVETRPHILVLLFAIIGIPAIGIALSERGSTTTSALHPFTKRGILGKLAAPLFAPGWPSGVFFTLLLIGIFVSARLISGMINDSHTFDLESDIGLAAVIGASLFPAVILIFSRADETSRFSNYFLISIAAGIFMLVMFTLSQALSKDEMLWFFIWNPLTFLPLASELPTFRRELLIAASMVAGCYALVLAILASLTLRRQRQA